MKALTLTQPWAGLVASGIKRVENRPRAMGADKMIGERVAIHASRQIDEAVYVRIRDLAPDLYRYSCPDEISVEESGQPSPWYQLSREKSAIIAVATIDKVLDGGWNTEAIARHADDISFSTGELLGPAQARWFFGPVGILLRDVRAIDPIRDVKGALGFWNLKPEYNTAIVDQIGRWAA